MIGLRASHLLFAARSTGCRSTRGRVSGQQPFSRCGMSSSTEVKDYKFGPWPIETSEVFLTSPLSFAFVNLKPVVPGHVLVSPKRVVPRFQDLTPEELADIWALAQTVGTGVERFFAASSLTFTIQDGPQAGQTVPHVHIHILPRKAGDFAVNDQIYDEIDAASKIAAAASQASADSVHVDAEEERKPRTREEMTAEAFALRGVFASV